MIFHKKKNGNNKKKGKMMKKLKLNIGVLLALSVAACSDDMDMKYDLPVSGEEIAFGTQLEDFSTPKSRTIYGVPDNESVDDYTRLTIKWKEGDQVRVYSPQAESGFQWADYKIAKTEGDASQFYLTKDDNVSTGVRWGTNNAKHNFYAFYPTNIGRDATYHKPISGLDGKLTVTANIPVAQEKGELVVSDNVNGTNVGNVMLPYKWKLIRPDMTYAMMAGFGSWAPGENPDVTLSFKPLVTVVDVVINGPDADQTPMNIYSVSVVNDNSPIVGDFTCTFNDDGSWNFSGMSSEITENNNIATINCTSIGTSGMVEPVRLEPGEKLTLKFFLLPREVYAEDLRVSVQVDAGRRLEQHLVSGESTGRTEIQAGKIIRVITPNLKTPEASNWMSLIDKNVIYTELSLPGSKHSYTGDLYKTTSHNVGWEDDIMQFYQSLYVANGTDTQFDKGIRAFDLKIRNDENKGPFWNPSYPCFVYAGGSYVKNSEDNENMELSDVLNNLNNKLSELQGDQSYRESVVVCLNFVGTGDADYFDTWLSRVEGALSDWNKSHPGVLKRIKSNTTVDDMKRKIAVIINMSSNTDGSLEYVNYMYNVNSSVQNMDISNHQFNEFSVKLQNLYQANNPTISQQSGSYFIDNKAGLVPFYITEKVATGNVLATTGYDLLGKKEELMNDLFTQKRNDKNNNFLIINDLAGFCVTLNDESTGYGMYRINTRGDLDLLWSSQVEKKYYSYRTDKDFSDETYDVISENEPSKTWGGMKWLQFPYKKETQDLGQGGNTVVFAQQFNKKATNAVYNMVDEGRVPMGIVFMNFAGTEFIEINGKTYEVFGETLPSLVMSNNFMFPLETGPGEDGTWN